MDAEEIRTRFQRGSREEYIMGIINCMCSSQLMGMCRDGNAQWACGILSRTDHQRHTARHIELPHTRRRTMRLAVIHAGTNRWQTFDMDGHRTFHSECIRLPHVHMGLRR